MCRRATGRGARAGVGAGGTSSSTSKFLLAHMDAKRSSSSSARGSAFSFFEALVWCFPLSMRSASLVLTFGSRLSGAMRLSRSAAIFSSTRSWRYVS